MSSSQAIVKMDFIKEESEEITIPEPWRVKIEQTDEQRGLILHHLLLSLTKLHCHVWWL